jgi:ATP-binding cassette, subfamily C, bacterial
VNRHVRFAATTMRPRAVLALVAWSVPEAVPATVSGLAVARAIDSGFTAGRPVVGLGWLAVLLAAAAVGALGTGRGYRRLGQLVEPLRDELVRRVVDGALRRGVAGEPDDGAVARLTHQVEIVRDAYAGLIVVLRSFAITVIGAAVGLLSLSASIALLVMPPFLLGLGLFATTLGMAAGRQRAFVRADERLAARAGTVLAGSRDLVACGAEEYAVGLVAGPVAELAAAERALARVQVSRSLCFALGGWAPLVILVAAAPWLSAHGASAGQITGGLLYVLSGLQPALGALVQTMTGSGLRFAVVLGRILDVTGPPAPAPQQPGVRAGRTGYGIRLRGVTFRYGPHAEPVLHALDLDVPPGDHLAVVGPSGTGKSTLAGLVCGLLTPERGSVDLGGAPVGDLTGGQLAAARVLIPQEAYVFAGTVWENLTYLNAAADRDEVAAAVGAVGADGLVRALGGDQARVAPAELSAGERQLISLARAYLSPAPVAVLDEATCHLDPAAERRVEEAFAARGGTLIVIAHRISSARRARRILVLDGAAPVLGDHEALLAASPLYRKLAGYWEAGRNTPPLPTPPLPTPPMPAPPMPAPPLPVGSGHRAVRSDPAGVVRDADGLNAGARMGLGDTA